MKTRINYRKKSLKRFQIFHTLNIKCFYIMHSKNIHLYKANKLGRYREKIASCFRGNNIIKIKTTTDLNIT